MKYLFIWTLLLITAVAADERLQKPIDALDRVIHELLKEDTPIDKQLQDEYESKIFIFARKHETVVLSEMVTILEKHLKEMRQKILIERHQMADCIDDINISLRSRAISEVRTKQVELRQKLEISSKGMQDYFKKEFLKAAIYLEEVAERLELLKWLRSSSVLISLEEEIRRMKIAAMNAGQLAEDFRAQKKELKIQQKKHVHLQYMLDEFNFNEPEKNEMEAKRSKMETEIRELQRNHRIYQYEIERRLE